MLKKLSLPHRTRLDYLSARVPRIKLVRFGKQARTVVWCQSEVIMSQLVLALKTVLVRQAPSSLLEPVPLVAHSG